MNKHLFTALALGVATTGVASAQANDECAGAISVGLGATAYDSTAATDSTPTWPCVTLGLGGGADLWYTYTAASTNDIQIETCGTGFDTALEAFSGDCNNLVSIACNDDSCGLQSAIVISNVNIGDVITFRVGGYNGGSGAAAGPGTVTLSEITPPPCYDPMSPSDVGTLFASNNGGSPGGAVYFDVTSVSGATISSLATNYAAAGLPVGIEVYTTPGTSVGNETNLAAWTLVAMDDGNAIGEAEDTPTEITLMAPFSVPAGTTGIALVAIGAGHEYTNGTGINQAATSCDGNLSLSLGTASNVPFTGGIFSPRVWNGELRGGGPAAPGTNYCTALVNSTGSAASISAMGSSTASDNDFTVIASGMPAMQFGIFLTSETQAATPVASGILCLGGNVIRFQGPGQILQADANGEFSLAIDLTSIPAGVPTPIVAGDTYNWAAWFRDTSMMGPTANFTDGLEVTFN